MGFFTEKRQIDAVSLVSVVFMTAILTFFASWLYLESKTDKMKSSYELKVELIQGQLENLQKKNLLLQEKLDKIKDAMSEEDIETVEPSEPVQVQK